ncbi:Enoyl-CoA hydratase [Sphingobium indicum BiD32]|uniref:Enoyl-CoA hydratase n=1 Tax=Sphingobium indicum BiD32 TaxID=1301087 RepID=N1MLL0_9SPHN|nr:enoyl-CoA hydratase-related protein [Sphingobium indicum]CCW16343.1 Enoyl-CoA hydratase [Sphingobium indicum BiD32]
MELSEATPVAEPRLTTELCDRVGILTLSRPEKRNALDIAARQAIAQALSAWADDDRVHAVVITGGDKVFAAGADLNLLSGKGAQAMADVDLPQYWRSVTGFPKPLIAAVAGVALGAGCELAMMCDIVVADRSARFGQPEIAVGIMPGAGGTQRLVRVVGAKVASLMLLTAEPLDAERAFACGLVSTLTDEGRAFERAFDIAKRIAQMPPKAVRAIRRVLASGADLPLDAALALEYREFLLLFDTADKTEGVRAFLDRRSPVFEGR